MNSQVGSRLSAVVTGVCLTVALVGLASLVVWVIAPGRGATAALTPDAASGALAAAGALWLLAGSRSGAARWTGAACAGLALALGGITLSNRAANTGVDLAAIIAGRVPTAPPVAMDLPTAIMLTLTGGGLLLLWRRQILGAQWCAVLVGFMSAFALQAWIYRALSLYDIPEFSLVRPGAIVCFLLLAGGLLFAPGYQGIASVFAGRRPGGHMTRRLWLPLVVLILGIGTLIEWVQHAGWLAPRTDSALLALWIAAWSSYLVWVNARSLNRLDDELRRTAQTLRRQASLFDQTHEGMVVSEWHGLITFWNRGAERLYGYTQHEATGRRSRDLLRTTAPGGLQSVIETLERDRYWEGELRHRDRGGHEVIVDARMTLVEEDAGTYLVEASRDITERVQSDAALRESERRFRQIAEWLPQLVWTCEADGWCDYLSQRWLHFTGSTLAQEAGYGWVTRVHPDDRAHMMAAWRSSVDTGTDFRTEFRIRRSDGVYRWFDTRALPLRDETGAVVKWFGSNTDIDDERAIRETLRANEERLALALEINQAGAWDLDVITNTVRRSPEHDRIFGYEELQDVWTFDSFVAHVVPEERRRVRRLFEKTFTSAVDEWSFDCRIQRTDGETRWIAVRGRSKRGAAGAIEMLSGVVQDVTQRKAIEEEILRLNTDLEGRVEQRTQELERANRELEAFSYSVSHDLRAPLRTVDGYSQAVLEDFGADLPEEAHRYLRTIRDGAQRMGRLIDDLLAFSRLSRQPLNTRAVDMQRLACEAWHEVMTLYDRPDAEIVVEALPVADGDPALLKQVWLNLLSNALKYSRHRAPPRVWIGHSADGTRPAFFVRDNGTGFDMQYAHKLFGVFQRLHRAEEFDGTGVGLAIVQRIIHRHGGRIWAEAAVDEGATFRFTLEPEGSREPQRTH